MLIYFKRAFKWSSRLSLYKGMAFGAIICTLLIFIFLPEVAHAASDTGDVGDFVPDIENVQEDQVGDQEDVSPVPLVDWSSDDVVFYNWPCAIPDIYARAGSTISVSWDLETSHDEYFTYRWEIQDTEGYFYTLGYGKQFSFNVASYMEGYKLRCKIEAEASDGFFEIVSDKANLYILSEPYQIYTEATSYDFNEIANFSVILKDGDSAIWYIDDMRVFTGPAYVYMCSTPGRHLVRVDIIRSGYIFDSHSIFIDVGLAPDDVTTDLEAFLSSPVSVTRYEYEILKRITYMQYAATISVGLIFILIFKTK